MILTAVLSGPVSALRYVKDADMLEVDNMTVLLSAFDKDTDYIFLTDVLYDGKAAIVPPVGVLVMIIGAAASLICGIVGAFNGKIGIAIAVTASVALIGVLLIAIGFLSMGVSAAGTFGSVGLLAALVVGVLATVFGFLAGTGKREKAKEVTA